VLKEADVVACEDTRTTKKLLSHFDIHTPVSNLTHTSHLLEQGKHVALVSDAGTPGISDPGLEIVSKAREFGFTIETIPGPSALVAAVAIAGLKVPTFTFYGFLPVKKGRESLFKEIASSERASVFYESPHRILKSLEALSRYAPERRIGLFRELTKVYEEALIGTPLDLCKELGERGEIQRGEFVVIVESL
jgi:16S rRNA (cytidine1402-2'-O)-methyltransferase